MTAQMLLLTHRQILAAQTKQSPAPTFNGYHLPFLPLRTLPIFILAKCCSDQSSHLFRSQLRTFTRIAIARMEFRALGFSRMSIVAALVCRRMLIASIFTLNTIIRWREELYSIGRFSRGRVYVNFRE